MKRYCIFLSIFSLIIFVCIGLSIFCYHEYYQITKEIYKIELNHTFTSLIPFANENGEITPQERPDTSGLQADANSYLTLGIIFTVFGCIALALLILKTIKAIRIQKTKINKTENY